MSTARPDTSRRREPTGPGRCFGPRRPGFITQSLRGLQALALAWTLCVAAATAAAEDDGPIVLTNEDVARLHAQPEASDDAARGDIDSHATMDEPTDAGDAEDLAALEKDLRARLDRISRQSMGSVSNALDTRLSDTSQPPLRPRSGRAPAAVSAPAAPMPGAADARPPTPESPGDQGDEDGDGTGEDAPAYLVPPPACVYGTRNQLLYRPEGSTCPPVRARTRRSFESGESAPRVEHERESERVGCVYGSRGQLLYSSEGFDCPPVGRRS